MPVFIWIHVFLKRDALRAVLARVARATFFLHPGKDIQMVKRLSGEIAGTFILMFGGCGAVIANTVTNGAVTRVGIAMSFGLAVATGIFALGDVSGAHFNPAVTLGFVTAGRFSIAEAIPYILAQCVGAFIAIFALQGIYPGHAGDAVTLPLLGNAMQSFYLETALTFFLVFTILNVTTGAKEKGITAALAIGGVLMLDALFGGAISGASMNPARSFAPAVIAQNYTSLWVYFAGPILGGQLAVLACKLVR